MTDSSYLTGMRQVMSLFSMLALLVVMTIPGSTFDDASTDAARSDKAPIVAAEMADMLADCCAGMDGVMHHAAGACPMDCATGVPVLRLALGVIDAGLILPRAATLPEGLGTTPYRPPIVA